MSPEERLHKELYLVRIPSLFVRGVEDLKQGSYITGDSAIDRTREMDLRTIMISIADMLEYYKEGAPIYTVNPDDPLKIYQAIQDFLDQWLEPTAPFDPIWQMNQKDVEQYDEFAHYIFQRIKPKVAKAIRDQQSKIESAFNQSLIEKRKETVPNIERKRLKEILEKRNRHVDFSRVTKIK